MISWGSLPPQFSRDPKLRGCLFCIFTYSSLRNSRDLAQYRRSWVCNLAKALLICACNSGYQQPNLYPDCTGQTGGMPDCIKKNGNKSEMNSFFTLGFHSFPLSAVALCKYSFFRIWLSSFYVSDALSKSWTLGQMLLYVEATHCTSSGTTQIPYTFVFI